MSNVTDAIADSIKNNPVMLVVLFAFAPSASMLGGVYTQKSYATTEYVDSKDKKLDAAISRLTDQLECNNAGNIQMYLENTLFNLTREAKEAPEDQYLKKEIYRVGKAIKKKGFVLRSGRCMK